jgi:Cu-Zn family superoxide dismutase
VKILYSLMLSLVISATVYSGDVMAQKPAKRAVALLNATKGNRTQGSVTFEQAENGVLIIADVEFLEPGKHAFTIHEYGDCSAPDGSSIGGHYNPTRSRKHGGPHHLKRHAGDLGNIVGDHVGHGHYERVDSMITLEGPHSIIGKSIAIHANADDFTTQPHGNSGGCICCGVIE